MPKLNYYHLQDWEYRIASRDSAYLNAESQEPQPQSNLALVNKVSVSQYPTNSLQKSPETGDLCLVLERVSIAKTAESANAPQT